MDEKYIKWYTERMTLVRLKIIVTIRNVYVSNSGIMNNVEGWKLFGSSIMSKARCIEQIKPVNPSVILVFRGTQVN